MRNKLYLMAKEYAKKRTYLDSVFDKKEKIDEARFNGFMTGVDATLKMLENNKEKRCKCDVPKYNYPEMVWCDNCGGRI